MALMSDSDDELPLARRALNVKKEHDVTAGNDLKQSWLMHLHVAALSCDI